MSGKSWLKEFMPIPANETVLWDWIKVTGHSLLKWTGALPDNLAKHNVVYRDCKIIDYDIYEKYEKSIRFGSITCSLCVKSDNVRDEALLKKGELFDSKCHTCPLYEFLGVECGNINKYGAVYCDSENDPKPMISALKGTLEMLKNREKY